MLTRKYISLITRRIFLHIAITLSIYNYSFSQTGADILYFADSTYNIGLEAARLLRQSVPFQANVRNFFISQNLEQSADRVAYAIGGSLNWNPTIWKDHLKAGVTMMTSQKIYGPSDKDGSLLLGPGQESYAALGEYYLSGSFEKVTFHIGAMEYNNPLFSGADIRMNPITHRGININYRADADNYFGIAVFDAIKWLNASSHMNLYEFAGFDNKDVVWALGAKRKLSDHSFGMYSSLAPDYYLGFYSEGSTATNVLQNKGTISLQYMFEKSVGAEIGGSFFFHMIGGKIDLTFNNFTAVLGYTFIPSDDRPQQVWGIMPYYNMMIFSFFNRPKEHAIRAGLIKPIRNDQKLIANVGSGFTPNSGESASPNAVEYNLTLDYTWKNIFNFRLRGAYYDEFNTSPNNNTNDVIDIRFIINYYWKSNS